MSPPQNRRTLILFPGLTGPYNEKYRPAYESLRAESKRFGYDECLIIAYPGQADSTGQRRGQLSLTSATEYVKRYYKVSQSRLVSGLLAYPSDVMLLSKLRLIRRLADDVKR